MIQKVGEGKKQHLSDHHGLIKLIVMDELRNLIILVLWNNFIDMDRETFIGTQKITLRETYSSSIRGREWKK